MTKAEMQGCAALYRQRIEEARAALHSGDVRRALDCAAAAIPSVDGMMQYSKKYEGMSFESVEAFDIVIAHSPLLFAEPELTKVEELIAARRRIDRDTTVDEVAMLAIAREIMRDARTLWNYVERHGSANESVLLRDLGSPASRWKSIIDRWTDMEVLRRTRGPGGDSLSLWTRIDQPVESKCPNCGAIDTRPKIEQLRPLICRGCRRITSPVLRG